MAAQRPSVFGRDPGGIFAFEMLALRVTVFDSRCRQHPKVYRHLVLRRKRLTPVGIVQLPVGLDAATFTDHTAQVTIFQVAQKPAFRADEAFVGKWYSAVALTTVNEAVGAQLLCCARGTTACTGDRQFNLTGS